MLSDFVSEICKKESLCRIEYFGTATQSSLSKWSKPNDAQRAVNGVKSADFAFHTDIEDNPWWQIEFTDPELISYIIINNRKKEPYDEVAVNIRVTGITDTDDEVIIHTGNLFFKALPDSLPLILPLGSKFSLKKIIISLEKRGFLHLSSIYILQEERFRKVKKERFLFVSNRNDGLGERLRALLTSMVLARKYNADFTFSWHDSLGENDFHAIESAHEIFGDNFIKKYLQPVQAINNFNLVPIRQVWELNEVILNVFDGILVQNHPHILEQVKFKPFSFEEDEYGAAFSEIEFSKKINKVKNFVNEIIIDRKTIAIHFRSGDIVYGDYRFTNIYYNKIIPIYAIDSLISLYKSKGYKIIVFGQDYDFCRYVATQYNLSYSEDIIDKNYDSVQRAMFDILLMSRCSEIIAGNSGFAIISSWIGNSALINYKEKLSEKQLWDSFYKLNNSEGILRSNKVHKLLKSFTYAQFYDEFKDTLKIEESIRVLEKAVSLDNSNSYINMLLANLYFKNNRILQGEKLLYDEFNINRNSYYSIEWLAKRKYVGGSTILSEYIDCFEKAISDGSIMALIIVLWHEYFYLKTASRSYYTSILKNTSKDKLGYDLLRNQVSRLL